MLYTHLNYGNRQFVVYGSRRFEDGGTKWPSTSVWLVPGTWMEEGDASNVNT